MRPWIVWGTGLLAYIVAVLDRTTLGVSGLDAAERFDASPSVLSTFVVLQVIVYAGAQVPAGVLLDRFGSKTMILAGGALMAAGQLTLAFTESLPVAIGARAMLGLGDAFTFISVLRLVPYWFNLRQMPLVTQLTGIMGQLGQVLSAIPFFALLDASGWSTAYVSVAAFGVMSMALTLALVKNTPNGDAVQADPIRVRETASSVKTVWMRPGTRLGFFTHMGTQFSVTAFTLMWGVPYLTKAQGQSPGVAGMILTVSVASAICSGVLIGIFTGRYPHRRSWIVLGIIGSNALIWTVLLALPGPAPLWLLIVLIVVISVGGPGSMVGFDYARTFNPSATLGTASGLVNMGGFLASLLVMQAMGIILDLAGEISFDSFRAAWTVQYVIWVVAVLGILITRAKARRLMQAEQAEGDALLLESAGRSRG
ncbi:sugar phosphate permease [Mycolicibacterium phlei]|uniref:MFS transporter n=1 Tax=Mycolicibacterium phlei DSM 43239 = CCUG 21000 TaxID=1226750 RepID=A0A5N5US46_MYCPH|nr:MFS transporter [Mycolicibacterium phlei]VEG10587.1 sugar phosphate permease [Mycobacteroides chelonae]AMO62486.1 putative galactarate transporter [Mycolicibacterium phlei]KAB7750970.1 MFS transporter [Mycolicibacterium phlei DSM 43239 = CCUG 21000]KXW61600.1 MFS transporter [Mycolicibacterium phlei DSM 43239 = CCUG 21000]KXW77644.1 MFS transporter [Mycolicibacterium phlei DSM 43071]